MDKSTLLSEIKRSLKEPETGGHWTDAELLRRINSLQADVCRRTECVTDKVYTASVAGTSEYDLPTNYLKMIYVKFDQKRLFGTSLDELNLYDSNWREASGTPDYYYTGDYILGLYKNPDESSKDIDLYYYALAADLVNDTDEPFDGKESLQDAHQILIDGVVYKCLLEDGNEFYKEYKSMYDNGIFRLRRAVKDNPDELVTFSLIKERSGTSKTPLPFMTKE